MAWNKYARKPYSAGAGAVFNEFTDTVNFQARMAAYADRPGHKPWVGWEDRDITGPAYLHNCCPCCGRPNREPK